LAGASSPAFASTVLGSDITEGENLGVNVHYRFGDRPSTTGSFAGSYWDISGQGAVYQLCAELRDHDAVAPSYSVTEGLTTFGDVRDAQLTTLYSNAFPLLNDAVNSYLAANNGSLTKNNALAGEWAAIGQYSVALQTLTWVIVENNNALIAPADPATVFGIMNDGAGDPVATGYIMNWADQINTGAWTAKSGVKLYHAASSVDSTQDRFWMTTSSAVPEPGAWALMIVGFGVAGTAIRTGRQRKPLAIAA
jgi:hypothetical protein